MQIDEASVSRIVEDLFGWGDIKGLASDPEWSLSVIDLTRFASAIAQRAAEAERKRIKGNSDD